MHMSTVAILGTGRMGTALARAFLDSGHEVRLWNRTPARAKPLVEAGAQLASSVREAVSAAELVVSIVSDYTTSDALLRAPDAATALLGKTLVQLASGSPLEARRAAAWAREHDVHYLDGAIMATPDLIGKPESTILYAGQRALFEAREPVLRNLAGTTAYVGTDHGHAAALDGALLMSMWGTLFGALQGIAISQAEGVPLGDYLAYAKGLMPVADGFAVEVIERAMKSDYGETQATLDSHHGALQHVLAICKERGLDRTVPDAFDHVMTRGRERGLGPLDFTALMQLMR
jgi:3-hydroxyisobutyrate dehydrogenase-like beta-hydroxyacid dehydrogenase